jgi:hypothetical protein
MSITLIPGNYIIKNKNYRPILSIKIDIKVPENHFIGRKKTAL